MLAAAVAFLAGALFLLAALSAPSNPAAGPVPAVIQVHAGDTLWAIATRVAPRSDPRAEVAALQRLNHLTGADVMPGQLLHTR